MKRLLTEFAIGAIVGFISAAIIFISVAVTVHLRNKDRERENDVREYVERQIEVEALREDYGNRDAVEFLESVPDVRRAADGAAADFERKRDEILHRFRNRLAD